MNTKTLLTVKIDKSLKEDAQKLASDLGIPLGTYINMNLRQFVRDRSFVINDKEIPNEKTMESFKSTTTLRKNKQIKMNSLSFSKLKNGWGLK
jgi:antitoxin component of RelBE/YafQ-DinJ toxin-antitoxin module